MAKLPESFDPKTAPFGWGSNQKTDNVGTHCQQNNDDVMEQQRKMEAEMAEKEKLFHATFPKEEEEEDYELSDEAMDRIIEENRREMGIIEPQAQPGASAWTSQPPEPVNNGWGRGWGSPNSASEYKNESDDEQKGQLIENETISLVIEPTSDYVKNLVKTGHTGRKKYNFPFNNLEVNTSFKVPLDYIEEKMLRTYVSKYAKDRNIVLKVVKRKELNYYEIARIV